MNLKSLTVTLLSVIIIFGGILVFDVLGMWETESTKIPLRFEEGEFAGMPNPADIRGSYSFKDIENAFGIKSELIAEAFNIESQSPDDLKAKDIEEIYGEIEADIEIGTGSVRKFVSLYTGLPYESDDYLPSTALDILRADGKISEEIDLSLRDYIIEVGAPLIQLQGPDRESGNEGEVEDEGAPIQDEVTNEDHEEEIGIKGKTTVNDAISYGITLEEIQEILGVEIPNKNMLIRDICEQNGLSFSLIKEELNAKIK